MTLDVRPAAHIIGLLLVALGAAMLFPAALDLASGEGNWRAFLLSAAVTAVFGAAVALASRTALGRPLDIRQAYLLTSGAWIALALFGALPFMLGAPGLSFTEAVFEAMSGVTTTGSSMIAGLDRAPPGMNLWRGILNWVGGLGVAFVAMIFLPVMRVGGMQFFRAQGFDTLGKVMPRAADIARSLLNVYAGLTLICYLAYLAVGMTSLDAVVMAASTLATGGFSPTDQSFGKYGGPADYVGTLFMALAALPYIRYVQLLSGSARPFWHDTQVRVFLGIILGAAAVTAVWRVGTSEMAPEPAFREALFNLTSIMTTTGFSSGSFAGWGPFAIYVGFLVGLVGGCSGTSSASLSVFRVVILFKAVQRAVQRIVTPDRVLPIRYEGRAVDADTVNGVVFFVNLYVVIFGTLSVAVALTGVDAESAVMGVWTSLSNIGYGAGPLVARSGTFAEYPEAAKWLLTLAMLLGRLGLLSFFVLLLPRFWRP